MDVEKGYMMKKIMLEIVATNIVASLPPEQQPTATPTTRAKKFKIVLANRNISDPHCVLFPSNC